MIIAKHMIMMKNSHNTNHKEWTTQDELNKCVREETKTCLWGILQ